MIDECGLCDARRDDVREYDAGSGLYLCRPCRMTEDEYRDIARMRMRLWIGRGFTRARS